ncbi:MAG TPA: helix-turn-helix domain-containing protein [Burkholderiaceae bacterium]|nr:helix-turn-helix domain-containing protein [Burkholderiaceae bacterium]
MMQIEPSERESGTTSSQTVGRAVRLLRLVLEAGTGGLKLRDATALTGWSKSTVHRLLAELEKGGLLRRGSGKEYLTGRFAYELGIGPSPLGELRELCSGTLERIAAETSSTVFLGIRSGASSLCLDYRLGAEIRPPVVPPRGKLRPLGVGAAGLAVLSRLPDSEVDRIGETNARRLQSYGVNSGRSLTPFIRHARSAGYAKVANIVAPGVVGIGACVADATGHPLCSISVVAPVVRMTTHREREAVDSIAREIELLKPLLLRRASLVSLLRTTTC